jgi:hypothetical protein
MLTSKSDVIIDWLSFSIPCYPESDVWNMINNRIAIDCPGLVSLMASSDWKETSGRAPYDRSYSAPGLRIFAAPNVPHFAIEISGLGCKILRDQNSLDSIVRSSHDRMSRIDLALDVETDVTPTQFVAGGYSKRIRTIGNISSDSGETVYIGSQQSDRYARVYRYAPPHPRSAFLRIEYVFRRKEAKEVASELIKGMLWETVMQANKTYNWGHELMDGLLATEGLTATVSHRSKAKTMRWLITQVAPAFRQLVKDGIIDNPDEFLATHFNVKNE